MPVTWEYRGDILVMSIIGIVQNEHIAQAFREALPARLPETALRLLWDGRRSETPLSSDDVMWRIDLVSSLAANGHFSRAAVLGRGDQGALFAVWVAELPKISQVIPFRAFTSELEALTWLRTSEEMPACAPAREASLSKEERGRPTRS